MTDQLKDEIGRGPICLHDKTTDGGEVIAATPKIFAQIVQTLAPYRDDLARERTAAASR